MHAHSRLVFEELALQYFKPGDRVLEIGPAGVPSEFQQVAQESVACEWETIDLHDNGLVKYVSRGEYDFGLESDTYDVVFCGNVLEHVRMPWCYIQEKSRVCRTGGKVITIAPTNWPYHMAPIDCWRFYSDAMRALHEWAYLTTIAVWHGTFDERVAKTDWGIIVECVAVAEKPRRTYGECSVGD